jgi:hypothetical protein
MLSGVDLIRTASHQQERLDRIKPMGGVAAVDSSNASGSSLDGDTQGALLRLARFISIEQNKEKPKPKRPLSVSKRKIAAYHTVMNLEENQSANGQLMDLHY